MAPWRYARGTLGGHPLGKRELDTELPNSQRNVAILVGNGLSIAFNPDLNLQSITEEVLGRIEAAGGGDVVIAMQEIAERALPHGATSAGDFEVLVGAFGAESRNLGSLETLAQLTRPADEDLLQAIKLVAEFAVLVRDNGISHVLEVISERSHAYLDEANHLHDLVDSVIDNFDGKVVFGNLNYDTLLLAALLQVCKDHLADMGHGYRTAEVTIDGGRVCRVPTLRRSRGDFPAGKRVLLLHLHGSLTYWASRDSDAYVKLSKELLDGPEQWRAVRERTTNIRPVIVLANQRDKTEHVAEYPFDLAYEMFNGGLSEAEHWLVVGYSFRDEPVNSMLRAEFFERDPKPKVLVVTYGEEPTQQTVERALGWGAEDGDSGGWLTINRDGANLAQESDDWGDFVASSLVTEAPRI